MPTAKKILKKTGIVLAVIAGLYLLILFIAGIYINTQKAKILAYIRTELKDKLRGNADISDLEITVWKHFPSIGFRMNDFVLSDSVYNKPLIAAKLLSTKFSLPGLLSSSKSISNIIMEDGTFNLFTDSTGYSNKYLLDFKKENTVTKPKQGSSKIEIKDIDIKNLSIIIEDKTANKEISMVVNELDASIDPEGKILHIEMDEKITMKKGLGFNLSKGAYLEKQALEGEWKLQMNTETKVLSFDKTSIDINHHPFELSGHFTFTNDPAFSVNIHTTGLPFDNARAIVTDSIRSKISLVQMKAPLDVDGSIAGSLLPNREPVIDIKWKTQNNTLSTPVVNFTDCSFDGNFTNHVNKDSASNDANSRITFNTFGGNWDGILLSAKGITITDLINPVFHFDFYSECTLQALDNKFALKDVRFSEGTAKMHLFYDGKLATDPSMLEDLQGELNVKNGSILYGPRNFNFTNCNGEIGFYKDSISVRNFSCQYLKNKMNVEVQGKNIRRKFIVGDISQEAIVKCFVKSPYINLEDFKVLMAAQKKMQRSNRPPESFKAVAGKLNNILANSVIGIEARVAEVKYQNLQAKNFEADIRFEPKHWEVARISLNAAGGSIVTNGMIIHNASGNHDAMITTNISNVDIKKLLHAFDDFGQTAITSQNLTGTFSANASLKTGISSLGKVIPKSLFGKFDFSLKNGALINYPGMMNIKTFVFKNRDMNNVRFAELKDRIEIKGTNVYLNRMEIQSNVMRLFVEGNYCLEGKNTDMLIQAPFSNLNTDSFTEDAAPKNKGTKAKVGVSIWLRAVNDDDGKVKVKLTFRPKLKDKKLQEKREIKNSK